MLSVNNISIFFSGEPLFQDVSFKINKGDRIGLAGKNGAGKTTLLKVLSGEQSINQGSLSYDGDIRIGILKQDIDFKDTGTLIQEIENSFVEIKTTERRIDQINHALETRDDYHSDEYMKLIEELHDLTTKFSMIGGYTYQGDIEKVLYGLGFEREDLYKSTSLFSGGWRMRIELAKLLLASNDVLLLDEPTNHLDIESILWLEDFLNKFSGAVVLVSHDRTFLDNVTNRTVEISMGRVYDFKHSYSRYLELRKEIREVQASQRKNQEKEIKETEKLIEKFRYKASKAAFAQSLIKKLEKTELVEVDSEDVAAMNIRFQVSQQPGKVIFDAKDVTKTFVEKQVLKGVNIQVERGDKIALVGKNGQGKTTFVRALLGEIDFGGEIEHGYNVKLGYYAQNQKESLEGEKTLIQTIEDEATEDMRARSRDLLGSFLFSGDAIDKKVKVLSGGERGRLAMCKLLVRPFNVLIMDEPTNHLDIRSKKILKEALKKFEGTLIVVSHDRDFLEGLTNKVYEFRDGMSKEYLGDINFYLEQRQVESFREMETDVARQIKESKKEEKTTEAKSELSYEQKRELEKDVKRLSNAVQKLEGEISRCETEIAAMDKLFADSSFDNSSAAFDQYKELKHTLSFKMEEWTRLSDELEQKRTL